MSAPCAASPVTKGGRKLRPKLCRAQRQAPRSIRRDCWLGPVSWPILSRRLSGWSRRIEWLYFSHGFRDGPAHYLHHHGVQGPAMDSPGTVLGPSNKGGRQSFASDCMLDIVTRFRTGRFERLRSGESGHSQPVGPFDREDGVEEHPAVAPPSAACQSARRCAPRFLPTVGRPSAVALRFVHRDQLTAGLPPARKRPCRAHHKTPRPARRPRGLRVWGPGGGYPPQDPGTVIRTSGERWR